jgi:hypothetical protein
MRRPKRAQIVAVSVAGRPAAKISTPVVVATDSLATPRCSTNSASVGHEHMIAA